MDVVLKKVIVEYRPHELYYIIMVTMNATEFFKFETPIEPKGLSRDEGLRLMPRNKNGAPKAPSTTKLIVRPSQNGFD